MKYLKYKLPTFIHQANFLHIVRLSAIVDIKNVCFNFMYESLLYILCSIKSFKVYAYFCDKTKVCARFQRLWGICPLVY